MIMWIKRRFKKREREKEKAMNGTDKKRLKTFIVIECFLVEVLILGLKSFSLKLRK